MLKQLLSLPQDEPLFSGFLVRPGGAESSWKITGRERVRERGKEDWAYGYGAGAL